MSRLSLRGFAVAGLLAAATTGSADAQQGARLGRIDFPTSGTSAEAQGQFLKGAAMLHSFEWQDAAEALTHTAVVRRQYRRAGAKEVKFDRLGRPPLLL